MRAAVCYEPRHIVVEELDDPIPGPGEVKLRVKAVGVCHTDLSFYTGAIPIPMPIVLGHEGAGIVERVGPGVTTVRPGDQVICSIIGPCRRCFMCLRGEFSLCENMPLFTGKMLDGSTRLSKDGDAVHTLHFQGTFAESAVVPERFVTPVRPDAPLDSLCGLACGASTGLGAAMQVARVHPGSSAVVVGAGGVGLSAMMGARFLGATVVVAVDLLDQRLHRALELGAATHVVNAGDSDVIARVHELTAGRGADYAFDAAGVTGSLDMAMHALRAGGTCVVIGRSQAQVDITLDTRQVLRQRKLTGTFGGSIDPQRHIPEFVDLCLDGSMKIGSIVDRRYTLDEIDRALDDLHHGRVTRGVVVF